MTDLVISPSGYLDMDLIYELFEDSSAAAIIRIPIPNSSREDQWVWVLESTGRFLVKLFLLVELEPRAPAGVLLDTKTWGLLWKQNFKIFSR